LTFEKRKRFILDYSTEKKKKLDKEVFVCFSPPPHHAHATLVLPLIANGNLLFSTHWGARNCLLDYHEQPLFFLIVGQNGCAFVRVLC
jgi:hypothetical protein